MKHIVKLTVSNPSHDFISMRVKMKQQDYITEARDESEAINRAARHFRTLGFKVHSAVIVEQKVEIPEPVALAEAVDYKALEKPTIARIKSGETKPADRTNYNVPPAMRNKTVDKKAALEAFIARRKETVTEEAAPQYIEEKLTAADPAAKWIQDFVKSDNPKFKGKSKEERIRMALGAKYASKRRAEGVAEEVELQEGDLSVRTLYNKFANAHVNGNDTESTEKVIRKVHGDVVMGHMKKAAKANAEGDMDGEDRHFYNAQTAAKKTDRIGGTVGRGRSEFMRKRREFSEEVEQIDEADIKSKPVMHNGKEIGETGIDSEAQPGNGKWYAKHHKSGMDSLGFDSRREAEAEVKFAHGVHEEVEQMDEARKMKSMFYSPEEVKAAQDHWKNNVKPVYKEHGLSPKFASAVDAHVKLHGNREVQQRHGDADGNHPRWFNTNTNKVRPLVKNTGYTIKESWIVDKEVKTNKASAAADKIVKVSKSKVNKVNMDPELNQDVKQSSRY